MSRQIQEEPKAVCDPAPSTEELKQDIKAILKGDLKSVPLAKYGISEQEAAASTSTKIDLTRAEEITTYTAPQPPEARPVEKAEQEQKPVHSACTTLSLEELQKVISKTIGQNFGLYQLKKLIQIKGQQKIQYHMEHWPIHALHARDTKAGYFYTVVMNDIEPVLPEKKPYYQANAATNQRNNFDQREYSDEELEKFYANLS